VGEHVIRAHHGKWRLSHGGGVVGIRVRQHIAGRDVYWILAAVVPREVGKDKADQRIAFTQVCQVVPLDTEIALAAAEACCLHKLAMADATIFATAQAQGATLLTCDKHFEGLPGVTLIEKIKA